MSRVHRGLATSKTAVRLLVQNEQFLGARIARFLPGIARNGVRFGFRGSIQNLTLAAGDVMLDSARPWVLTPRAQAGAPRGASWDAE